MPGPGDLQSLFSEAPDLHWDMFLTPEQRPWDVRNAVAGQPRCAQCAVESETPFPVTSDGRTGVTMA